MYTTVNPSFTILKWGARVYKSHGHVILMQSKIPKSHHDYIVSNCIFHGKLSSIFIFLLSIGIIKQNLMQFSSCSGSDVSTW